jgi:hypothetical protein
MATVGVDLPSSTEITNSNNDKGISWSLLLFIDVLIALLLTLANYRALLFNCFLVFSSGPWFSFLVTMDISRSSW